MAALPSTSFRLSQEARQAIERLRDRYATDAARPSAVAIIELALRRLDQEFGPAPITSRKSKKSAT